MGSCAPKSPEFIVEIGLLGLSDGRPSRAKTWAVRRDWLALERRPGRRPSAARRGEVPLVVRVRRGPDLARRRVVVGDAVVARLGCRQGAPAGRSVGRDARRPRRRSVWPVCEGSAGRWAGFVSPMPGSSALVSVIAARLAAASSTATARRPAFLRRRTRLGRLS